MIATNSMRPYYRLMRYLSQAALALYFRGRVFGREKVPATGGVVLACNHQSFFDPMSATCTLPREGNYMARDTLFSNPVFGSLIRSLNAFPVRRGTADVGAVKEVLRRLRDGKLVVIFPEGTRTRDGRIGVINPNSMNVAKKAQATIVPTIVDGAYEAWPRSCRLPRPRPVYVTYAEPITPAQMQDMSSEDIADIVKGRLERGLEASRRRRQHAAAFR